MHDDTWLTHDPDPVVVVARVVVAVVKVGVVFVPVVVVEVVPVHWYLARTAAISEAVKI